MTKVAMSCDYDTPRTIVRRALVGAGGKFSRMERLETNSEGYGTTGRQTYVAAVCLLSTCRETK